MSGIDLEDKIDNIKKYFKYLVLIIAVVVVIIVFPKSCSSNNYDDLESKVERQALTYIKENYVNIVDEEYIELSAFPEIEGTELCSKASGVIVKNRNGRLEAQAYLDCGNYKSNIVKNNSKYISLNGEAIMILNRGEAFNDPLYVLKKDADVQIDGYVGSTPGIYTLNYYVYVDNALKETLQRKVIVSNGDKSKTISGLDNLVAPSITLLGDKEMVLKRGEKYVEPGWKAVDYADGKISREVVVTPSQISTAKSGVYTIEYSVTNSKGVSSTVKRTVTVVEQSSNVNVTLNSKTDAITNKVTLEIRVTGSDYEEMRLPDGATTSSNYMTYDATHNDTYKFEIRDRYGNIFIKEIIVDNIDNVPPQGICKAVVTSSSTSISVTATDNKGITGYSYNLNYNNKNVNKTDFISSSSYEASVVADSVSVKIKDLANNESTAKCEIEKKSTIISGACGASDIYVTINTCYGGKTIRNNVPLEEYLMGVLYGEEAPSLDADEDYIKTFLIFARSYTLSKIGYWNGNNSPIKSCSSDQNWCDVDLGCYRDQTQEMFDQCINYAVNYPRTDYTADTCANRVTTFPGTANVANKTFYVNNSGWWGASSATSDHIRSSWHGPASEAKKAFYRRMIEETAGLIIYKEDGTPAWVNYYMCDDTFKDSTLCPNTAAKLAKQGYTMEELIQAYTQKYPNATVACYNKN